MNHHQLRRKAKYEPPCISLAQRDCFNDFPPKENNLIVNSQSKNRIIRGDRICKVRMPINKRNSRSKKQSPRPTQ
ncbi:hypothetical protein Leryth_027478 [Lithospermum erythrorhizon]|nr:hypothetical protein Leryth_027478 [Lithospermum erythrorhizon]